VREVTDELACIGLWGPAAREILQAVADGDVSNAAFPYMTGRTLRLAGAPAWAQRVTYVGELGWELYPAAADAVRVWDALVQAGRPHGLRLAGYKAIDSLRLEKGYRYWSSDITPAEHPYEAGLGFCVRLGKGDFIGREALVRIKAAGLTRRLCTVTMDPDVHGPAVTLYGGEAVFHAGRIVGRLRSGGHGYTVGREIGLVYLPLALAGAGTPLEIELFGTRYPAAVAADVLHDPAGQRIKA
jgi:4-methylaminobutanoate oxidase (formaldehyde-forming)